MGRVGLQLAAQVVDVYAHGALDAVVDPQVRGLQELHTAEYLPRMPHHSVQQAELRRRQGHHPLAAFTNDAALCTDVKGDVPEAVRFWCAGRIRRLYPPQHRAGAGHQLAWAERLGDVIVGAQLQPDQLVGLLDASGQHDDRHVRRAPQLPAHV